MYLSIGCKLDLRCELATPVLALVHLHSSLAPDLAGPERLQVLPDRSYELLTDQAGNRWCRLLAASGSTCLTYSATIEVPDGTDPVLPHGRPCPIQALPIDAYRFLNASTYCDTAALMELAWSTFAGIPAGWPLVQAICDWVHQRIRFDYGASQLHQSASQSVASGAGVCRDYAHLAITLCRCLNLPARYCTGYLGYTGIARGEAPVDFSAWFEVFLQDRWYVFDARHNIPRCGRVLIGRGLDAADVPFLRSFGAHQLTGFQVITEEIDASAVVAATGAGDGGVPSLARATDGLAPDGAVRRQDTPGASGDDQNPPTGATENLLNPEANPLGLDQPSASTKGFPEPMG